MKKEVDFSKGIRGKHAGMNLKIGGAIKKVWAVCVSKTDKNLILFKLYNIETFAQLSDVRVKNEKGKLEYYPKDWFAVVEVPTKTLGLLERTI